MDKLLSVGLDVGTTTTQLVISALSVENRGNAFSVPELIAEYSSSTVTSSDFGA